MNDPTLAREATGFAGEPAGAGPRPLLGLLGRLLIQIDPVEDVGLTTGSADRPPDRWEDDAYIYLEAMLPDVHDQDVDVCVHQGKVSIRMEK